MVRDPAGGAPTVSAPMKTYPFEDLTSAILAEVVTLRHAPPQPAFWDELARKDVGERERTELGFIVGRLDGYNTLRANEATV